MDKLIITAAITGNIVLPTQSKYLPTTPQQIIDDAVRAAEAGAASIHLHARDPRTAQPSSEVEVFREMAAGIKARCNAIVCLTTGGTANMTVAQRVRVVPELKPELATFNTGSMNFAAYPVAERYKDEEYKYAWEKPLILGTKDLVFKNTFADIEELCKTMYENDTKPEFESYDVGHLHNINFLIRRKVIKTPIWLQFVTGVLGGIGSSVEDVVNMKTTAERLFGRENFIWSLICVGYPAEFDGVALATIMGGHARVGMEDNIFIQKGVLAKSNAELVEKAVKIARELGREVATPDEARQLLGLKGKDKVNY